MNTPSDKPIKPLSLIERTESLIEDLPRGESRFARFLLKSPELVINQSIQEIASQSGASEPTIVRFSKRMNFHGFRDFKAQLAKQLKKASLEPVEEKLPEDPFIADQITLQRSLRFWQDRILQSLPPERLKQFLERLNSAKNILILTDESLKPLAEIAFAKLTPLVKRVTICPKKELASGLIQRLNKSDLLCFFHDGQIDLLHLVLLAKQRKIPAAAFGKLPAEPSVDFFFGANDFNEHLELSILLSLTQIEHLLPKHFEESEKSQLSFQSELSPLSLEETIKSLQGELAV